MPFVTSVPFVVKNRRGKTLVPLEPWWLKTAVPPWLKKTTKVVWCKFCGFGAFVAIKKRRG
ncbi:MAG: hypothetical protein DA408_16295 [Bacteroidetes bacterium]|nr:MAG: hypothetical protein C7N36_01545 [Bacteroidota bacterium]PTM10281.1 MAG: hypothetical protein DA408_16295 [Bacteroidota bacterium]